MGLEAIIVNLYQDAGRPGPASLIVYLCNWACEGVYVTSSTEPRLRNAPRSLGYRSGGAASRPLLAQQRTPVFRSGCVWLQFQRDPLGVERRLGWGEGDGIREVGETPTALIRHKTTVPQMDGW